MSGRIIFYCAEGLTIGDICKGLVVMASSLLTDGSLTIRVKRPPLKV